MWRTRSGALDRGLLGRRFRALHSSLAVSFTMLLSAGCQGDRSAEGNAVGIAAAVPRVVLASEATPIDPPAAPGSTAPALAAEHDRILERHFLLATWMEPDGDARHRLRFARFLGEVWSAPYTIARGIAAPPDRSPSLTVADTDTGRATLLARAGSLVARSSDGGRIWQRVRSPALSFASFVGGFEEVHAFWLTADVEGSAKLWGAPVVADASVLDPRVSECTTAAARTAYGPIVVYRDRSQDDVRDVAIVRRDGERWTTPHPVHADGWRLADGPLPGPAVAARDRRVIVGWYTQSGNRRRLLVAFSSDAGAAFAEPIVVDGPVGNRSPSGAISIGIDDDGHALVLWVTRDRTGDSTLLLSRVAADGRRGRELPLATMPTTRLRNVPQLIAAGERLAVAWEEGGASAGVRAVSVRMDAIPALPKAVPPPSDARVQTSFRPSHAHSNER